jgi:uncharacterized repeat protein (TIGR01451 family)
MKQSHFRLSFLLFFGIVFPWNLLFAGQGDFAPTRSGITSTQYPNGLDYNEFNLFTDDSALANSRRGLHGTDKSAHLDERDFVAASKGECNNTIRACVAGGARYEHSLNGLNAGDMFNVHVYMHNNAEQGAGFVATGTKVKLDWSDLSSTGKIKATISADNTHTKVIHDFVDIGFVRDNLSIQLPNNEQATTGIFNIGNVNGSYGGVADLIVNFKVVEQLLPGIDIIKQSNPQPSTQVKIGDEIRYMLNVKNTGNQKLHSVTAFDSIPEGTEYISSTENGDIVNNTLSWSHFSLEPNESIQKTFVVRVTSQPSRNQICNQAFVEGSQVSAESNQVCHPVSTSSASISIAKNSVPSPNSQVKVGDEIEYSLIVANTSNVDAPRVLVADRLPTYLEYVSGAKYADSTRTVSFASFALKAGESTEKTFIVKVLSRPSSGEVCNTGIATLADVGVNEIPSNQVCHPISTEPGTEECGDGEIQDPEECDDGNTNNNDYCIIDLEKNYLCHVAKCGDGYIWNQNGGTEECDDGTQCADGTSCTLDTECEGIGDGVCATRDGDGCSHACTDEGGTGGGGGGGGSGSGITRATIGVCGKGQQNQNTCKTIRIKEDVDDPAWQRYKNCIKHFPNLDEFNICEASWMEHSLNDCLENLSSLDAQEMCARMWFAQKYPNQKLCGQTIPSQNVPPYYHYPIEVPIIGDLNISQGLIDFQCADEVVEESTDVCIAPCGSCVQITPTLTKEIIGNTTVSREDTVLYQINGTLMNTTQNHGIVEFLGGKLVIVDTVVSSESGGTWNRSGIAIDSVSQANGWSWSEDAGAFTKRLTAQEIKKLNNSKSIDFSFQYTMDVGLAAKTDVYKLKNVAFARAIITYKVKKFDAMGNPSWEQKNNQFCQNYGANDPATDGNSATVTIIRPFIESKSGSNIGLDFSSDMEHLFGDKSKITEGTNTSGRIFEGEGGFFGKNTDAVLEKINNFEGLGDFVNVNRNNFFTNLKNNSKTSSEKFFKIEFETTPNNSGIYFTNKSITLGGNLSAGGMGKTFIIESGDVTISKDFSISNGFAAFIIRNGDLIIAPNVENIDGIFIVEKGKIRSKNISKKQLNISGGFMGDAADLLDKRRFIGNNPDDTLEPSIRILFDLRVLTQTPPALEQFLGQNWRQEVE